MRQQHPRCTASRKTMRVIGFEICSKALYPRFCPLLTGGLGVGEGLCTGEGLGTGDGLGLGTGDGLGLGLGLGTGLGLAATGAPLMTMSVEPVCSSPDSNTAVTLQLYSPGARSEMVAEVLLAGRLPAGRWNRSGQWKGTLAPHGPASNPTPFPDPLPLASLLLSPE